VGKGYRKYSNVSFPEEKEGNLKEANRKLRDEIKNLKKIIKNLETENKTLSRSFNKSCDFIHQKVSDKNLEEVIGMINDFDYKETKKGREKEKDKKNNQNSDKTCPKCDIKEGEGYSIMEFGNFQVHKCSCGFREKVISENEGIERS
jgi:rubrerythrin